MKMGVKAAMATQNPKTRMVAIKAVSHSAMMISIRTLTSVFFLSAFLGLADASFFEGLPLNPAITSHPEKMINRMTASQDDCSMVIKSTLCFSKFLCTYTFNCNEFMKVYVNIKFPAQLTIR